MQTDAQKRAKEKYRKKSTVGKYLQLNIKTDSDILEHIEGKPFQPYIKQLIREDMKKEKAQ